MVKEDLLKYFISEKTGKLNATALRWHNIKCHTEIYDFMINYFPDANDQNSSAVEILYRIINDVYKVPVCPVCGKKAIFKRFNKGYGIFCSEECRRSEKGLEIISGHIDDYFYAKYGVRRPVMIDKELNEQMRQTNMKRHGQRAFNLEKQQETCMRLYGVKFYSQTDEFTEKIRKTSLEKRGVMTPFKDPVVMEKVRKSMTEIYGYDCNFKRPEVIAVSTSDEVREKQWESKKRNGTTNTSGIEELFEQFLIDNDYGYKRNYRSDLYPYHVDFYINDYDLYIEIQGHWTHGGHPFKSDSIEDQLVVDDWKRRSDEINFKGERKIQYIMAVKNWTVTDVKKRETAQINNLNYLEIFSCDIETCIKCFLSKINKI